MKLSTENSVLAPHVHVDSTDSDVESYNIDNESHDFQQSNTYFSYLYNYISGDDEHVDSNYLLENIKDDLLAWYTQYKVKQNALSALLSLLKNLHPELPKDAHTLLIFLYYYIISLYYYIKLYYHYIYIYILYIYIYIPRQNQAKVGK